MPASHSSVAGPHRQRRTTAKSPRLVEPMEGTRDGAAGAGSGLFMPLQGLPANGTLASCSLVSLGGEEPRLVGVVAGVGGGAAHGCPCVVGGTNLLFGAVSTHEQRPDDLAQGLARRPHAERSRKASTERARTRAKPSPWRQGSWALCVEQETALKGRSTCSALEQLVDASRTGGNTREPEGRAISRRAAAHFRATTRTVASCRVPKDPLTVPGARHQEQSSACTWQTMASTALVPTSGTQHRTICTERLWPYNPRREHWSHVQPPPPPTHTTGPAARAPWPRPIHQWLIVRTTSRRPLQPTWRCEGWSTHRTLQVLAKSARPPRGRIERFLVLLPTVNQVRRIEEAR